MAHLLFWINADAEMEWAAGAGYRRSSRMTAHCQRVARALRDDLQAWGAGMQVTVAAPGDEQQLPASFDSVLPWAPTASARALLPLAGFPDANVVAAANHRSFAAALSGGLEGAEFCGNLEAVARVLETPPEAATGADGWLLKRALGFSGRWRKVLTGSPSAADRTWIEASMAQYGGGLQIEPHVALESEWSVHGWIPDRVGDGGAGVFVGEPTAFAASTDGAFAGARPGCQAPSAEDAERLQRDARTVARALVQLGYHGPFGVDSFTYRDGGGALRWRYAGDINARLTMLLPAALGAAGHKLR